jgi:hypothetical protein
MMAVATSGALGRGQHLFQRIAQNQTSHALTNLLARPLPSCCSFLIDVQTAPQQQRYLGTYFDKKQADKEYRRELWNKKVERKQRLLTRRHKFPKNVLKDKFQTWWTQRTKFEHMLESKAKQAKMGWTIKVATIIERIPVIIDDHPQWLKEYMDLRAYLDQFGKRYPKELMPEPKQKFAFTDEELLGGLNEPFGSIL